MIDDAKLTRWYDFQAPFYHLWRDRYESPLVKELLACLTPSDNKCKVLDAGSGTGLFSISVAKNHPTWHITGVDLSRGMITVAVKLSNKLNLKNIHFTQGDAAKLPNHQETFDLVIAAGLFSNLNSPTDALLELHRVLKPGGKLLVVEYDRSQMTFVSRSFFKSMIFGYKLFSGIFRKFRFSENWNINSSTIEATIFQQRLLDAGFQLRKLKSVQSHLIFNLSKQDA
jgi:demethylmenaquinone methyltransferase/2-methoxy-6-polyprenyl-1,4-benzoquinol methylase